MNAVIADRGMIHADPLSCHLVYSQSFLDIWHEEKHDWLHLDWKGRQSQESVRAGANQLLELVATRHVYKILNDNTNTVGSWLDSVPWVVYDFLPRARKAGMQRAAHVCGRDKLVKLSAEAFKLLFDPETANIRIFNTMHQATSWLEQS